MLHITIRGLWRWLTTAQRHCSLFGPQTPALCFSLHSVDVLMQSNLQKHIVFFIKNTLPCQFTRSVTKMIVLNLIQAATGSLGIGSIGPSASKRESWKIENKLGSCILNQFQGSDSAQGRICQLQSLFFNHKQ